MAFRIDDDDLRPGIRQARCEFLLAPPGVHRRHHRADDERSVKCDGPLRVVSHGDRHTVAGFDIKGLHQRMRQRARRLEMRLIAHPLIFEDEKCSVLPGPPRQKQITNRARRSLVDGGDDAVDRRLLHLERRPWRSQQSVRFVDRHDWKCGHSPLYATYGCVFICDIASEPLEGSELEFSIFLRMRPNERDISLLRGAASYSRRAPAPGSPQPQYPSPKAPPARTSFQACPDR